MPIGPRCGVNTVLQAFIAIAVPVVSALASPELVANAATSSPSELAAATQATAPTAASNDSVSANTTGELQEVIVTATLREEAASKVPVSIQAVTNTQLEVAGVREFSDLVRLTPELHVNSGYANSNDVAIRGISSNAGASTTGIYIDDTPIQVINHYNNAGEQFPTVFDLQRVEVLRGPQGTLFGAGSEGGAVRFIQEQPSLTQDSGYARAEGASTDGHAASYEFGAAFGGPLMQDKVGFRISAYYRQDGGYIDFGPYTSATVNHPDGSGYGTAATMVPNSADIHDNANWTDTKAFRAALRVQPIEGLTITPSVFYQRQDTGLPDNDFYLAGSNPGADSFYVPQFIPGPVTPSCNHTGCTTLPGGFSQINLPTALNGNNQISLSALNIQWNIGQAATLTSVTSYTHWGLADTTDTTFYYAVFAGGQPGQNFPLPGQFSPSFFQTDNNAVTEELRLAGNSKYFNWLVGVFVSHDHQNELEYEENNVWASSNYFFGDYVPTGGPPFGPGYSAFQDFWGVNFLNNSGTYEGFGRTTDKQVATFAQVDIKFTHILSLTAGLRYAHDDLSFSLVGPGAENNENIPGGAPCPSGPVCAFGSGVFAPAYPGGIVGGTARPVTPKAALNAQLTDNNLVYVSATKGYRIGGGQLPVPADCAGDLANLGYVNGSGQAYTPPTYAPDYVWSYELGTKNAALDGRLVVNASAYLIKWKDIQTNIGLPTCGYGITANTGSATVKGFDFDAAIAPIHGLQFRADVGYTDASLDDGLYQPSGAAVYTRGSAVPGSGAPWNIVVSGRYEFPVRADVDGYLYADDRWDSQWRRTGRDDPGTFDDLPLVLPYPAYNAADVRLGIIRGGLDISLFMDNLLNAHPIFLNNNAELAYLWTASTIRPRMAGVTAAYRF